MPKHPAAHPAAPAFTSYSQILEGLIESAMALVNCLNAEMRLPQGTERALPITVVTRGFLVLSAVTRRTILVSRYLQTIPAPAEERAGQLLPMLDLVLNVFSKHKMDIETYNAMIDAELEGECDGDTDEDGDEMERYIEQNMDRDVTGRRPCILVAELCRDFGLALPPLPAYWLTSVPPDLRLLCARAAAAAIGPSPKPAHAGHLMER